MNANQNLDPIFHQVLDPCLNTTEMVGGPSIIFCRYHESEKSRIRSHQYTDAKICSKVVGFDGNSLYLSYSGQEIPCGKEDR